MRKRIFSDKGTLYVLAFFAGLFIFLFLAGCFLFDQGEIEFRVDQDGGPRISAGSDFLFGDCDLGSNKSIKFFIENTGSRELKIRNTQLMDTSGNVFEISYAFQGNISDGDKKDLIIKFQPSAEGEATARVSIEIEDQEDFTFFIKGNGKGYPQIEVQDAGGTALPNGGGGLLLPLGTSGSPYPKDSEGPTVNITVKNIGNGNLVIAETGSNPEGAIYTSIGSTTIPPDESVLFSLRPDTSVSGNPRQADFFIQSNSTEDSTFTFPCFWYVAE